MFTSHVEYDDAKIFHGEVLGIKDVITFQGITVDEIEQTFQDSVDDYLAFCKKRNLFRESSTYAFRLVYMQNYLLRLKATAKA